MAASSTPLTALALVVATGLAGGQGLRDLNKNGVLDVYEDPSRPVDERVEDLLGQMTLEEKAGLMFVYLAVVNEDASLAFQPDAGAERLVAVENVDARHLSHFNLQRIPDDPAVLAEWYDRLQQYAIDHTRLGIPVTLASDPRHHFSRSIFSFDARGFSQFPEPLGLAAIGDLDLVERFAEIVREEYAAVGIRVALHPQVDLATEPRWPRVSGGFGEDARLTAKIVRRYVHGLQGPSLSPTSVAAMTKHFPGAGPQRDGLDPHFEFQRGQVYPGGRFEYHLIPFEAAIEAGTAAIMPYYGVPVGQTSEDVGMAFNREIITGLLRDRFHYDGVVCADWGIITDLPLGDVVWPARAWGVESLSEVERVERALAAGVDQFGGERCPEHVVDLVRSGRVPESRIDVSARRLLRLKFQLGLFDDPFVDVAAVDDRVGRDEARRLGFETQRRAMTLLKNGELDGHPVLPLREGLRLYTEGIAPEALSSRARLVSTPNEADVAVIRLDAPWYPVDTDNPFAKTFHFGDLDFKGEAKAAVLELAATVPTVVVIYLDRPAVIPDIAARASALLADFGASDEAVADVLFGRGRPEGNLPFELPSSMEAVRAQLPDVPADSEDPLFPMGFGLRYDGARR